MSDTKPGGRREAQAVMKLLELHHRQTRELERLQSQLSRRTAATVSRLLGSLGMSASSGGPPEAAPQGAFVEDPYPALAAAAHLARELPANLRRAVASKLPPALTEEFLRATYSFDALPGLNRLQIQRVLQRANKRELAVALLGANDEHFHAVTSNMSERAANMLREDMESLLASGGLRTRDVQEARAGLSSIIREAFDEQEGAS
ncbi:MAG: FliG C-terminal domain-containing protein [Spirochaetota bacterium]